MEKQIGWQFLSDSVYTLFTLVLLSNIYELIIQLGLFYYLLKY